MGIILDCPRQIELNLYSFFYKVFFHLFIFPNSTATFIEFAFKTPETKVSLMHRHALAHVMLLG